ncbi:phytanoyl-CoA dioxygenase family protein [Streptomyces sp. NPDC088775]|uniref:phytanoyl-CoA dioxygenase family protein n=1 Tax=Streptomyces sp. NPDC088775 TaxID=3365896 RepID=UPI003803E408
MAESVNALTPLEIGNAAGVRRALVEQGYAFLPGMLPIGSLKRLYDLAHQIMETSGWLAANGSVPVDSTIRAETYAKIQRAEVMHSTLNHPRLLSLLRAVLGEEVFCHPRKTFRFVPPNAVHETTQPHQDYPYIQGDVDTITCWTPLHDVDFEDGPIRIVPASHLNGLLPMKKVTGAGGYGVANPPEEGWVSGKFNRGDVVIFHSLTVHAALPNLGNRFRLSMDSRYQGKGTSVNSEQLKPYPGAHGISTWEEIGSDWESLEPIIAPENAKQPFQAPSEAEIWHQELSVPPSRLF